MPRVKIQTEVTIDLSDEHIRAFQILFDLAPRFAYRLIEELSTDADPLDVKIRFDRIQGPLG